MLNNSSLSKFLLLILVLLFSACFSSSKTEIDAGNDIAVDTNQSVTLQARSNQQSKYLWKQIGGTEVTLIGTSSKILEFITPVVEVDEKLTFEFFLYSDSGELIGSDIVDVYVKAPITMQSENNQTKTIKQEDTTSENNITKNIGHDNNITTKEITIDINTSTQIISKLTSLELKSKALALYEGNTTRLSVYATYEDKSVVDVTKEIVWLISNAGIITIDKSGNILAIKSSDVTLVAKLNGVKSNEIKIRVVPKTAIPSTKKQTQKLEVINGHTLPPEPDPVLNNSTLLGIDTNDNGVRDDVERKIYTRYKKPVEQAYMMQEATHYPKLLENPVDAAASEELEKENWNTATCFGYLMSQGIEISNSIEFIESAYFNTEDRIRAYITFNEASGGGVYNIPLPRDDNKENCTFNIDELLKIKK